MILLNLSVEVLWGRCLLENVRAYISPTIVVKFEQVEALERTNTGKFKAVVSKL